MAVQADTARLIALFVSCILYGILLTTFVPSLRSLLFSASQKYQFKSHHEIKYPIVAATVLMFLVSSFAAVLSMQGVIDGFVDYKGPGGALEFYQTVNGGWKHWMVSVEDSAQVILGDGLLIYRCYVIYGRNLRIVVIPLILWMTTAAVSVTSSYRESILGGNQSLNDPSVLPFLTATLLLTFATSVVTTYLIIWRLEFRPHIQEVIPRHILSRVATIFLETGLIYTLSIVASFGVYLTRSTLEYVASSAMIHIIPITCNLLLIRAREVTGHAGDPPRTVDLESKEKKFNPRAADEV